MKIIPIIYLKNRKQYPDIKTTNRLTEDKILKILSDDKNLYIYDIDGIKGNKPNLCTYQRFSALANLWIDAAPRELGDIVDNLMAGGNNIIIQEDKWYNGEFSGIKKITQNQVFYKLELENKKYDSFNLLSKEGIDGIVVLKNQEYIRNNYTYSEYVKTLAEKIKLYGFETDPKNISYWKKINATGVFVEINKIEEFKKNK